MKFRTLIATTISTTMLATAAFASGNHAGGHHGDADAIGQPGIATKVTRTVNVEMTDAMRFTPADIPVKSGETIKFLVKNTREIKHEMVLGTEKDLKAHNEVMKKKP